VVLLPRLIRSRIASNDCGNPLSNRSVCSHHLVIVFGSLSSQMGMRFGWRPRIYMAPVPHVDGDPFWGLVRSRRRGPLPGARTALREVFGHLTAD